MATTPAYDLAQPGMRSAGSPSKGSVQDGYMLVGKTDGYMIVAPTDETNRSDAPYDDNNSLSASNPAHQSYMRVQHALEGGNAYGLAQRDADPGYQEQTPYRESEPHGVPAANVYEMEHSNGDPGYQEQTPFTVDKSQVYDRTFDNPLYEGKVKC